jgi:hypothetical protein
VRFEFRCDRETFDRFEEWLKPSSRFVDGDDERVNLLVPMHADMADWPKVVVEERRVPIGGYRDHGEQ